MQDVERRDAHPPSLRLGDYLDTSALAKLVFAETESGPLEASVAASACAVSALSRTELRRVGLRVRPGLVSECDALLQSCFEVVLTPALLDRAGVVQPPALRSVDAIHLASVLTLGREVEAFVAYDDRLLTAVWQAGLPVASPR